MSSSTILTHTSRPQPLRRRRRACARATVVAQLQAAAAREARAMSTQAHEANARIGRSAAVANFATVIAALAVAGALLLTLQWFAIRRQLVEDVRAQAHVVGLNSAAA